MSTYTYKNARLAVTNGYTTAYTCPAATTAVVLSAMASNIDGANAVTVSAQWLDSSAGSAATRLCDVVNIPVGAPALQIMESPQVLETGDVFQAKAGATSDVELSLSIVEIT